MQSCSVALLMVQNNAASPNCIQLLSMHLQNQQQQHEQEEEESQQQHSASPPVVYKPGNKFITATIGNSNNDNRMNYAHIKFEEHVPSCGDGGSSSSSGSDDCLDEHTISSAKKRLSWIGEGSERKRMGTDSFYDWGVSSSQGGAMDTRFWQQRNRRNGIRCGELRRMSHRCTSEDSICRDRKTSASQPETIETTQVNINVKCDILGFGLVIAGECPTCVKFVDKQGPAAVAGLKTGDEIMEINGQDVSSMKLQRLQEIFRKKFQAASWNRVRQYHLSITVRRQRIVTATQTNTATTSCTSATATSPRTQSWGVVQQQQQQEIHSSNRWN